MSEQMQRPKCDRCHSPMPFPPEYCAECGRNRCPACAEAGCCGHEPMRGSEFDTGEPEPALHVAGVVMGGVQKCPRCDEVLWEKVSSSRLEGFRPGLLILVEENRRGTVRHTSICQINEEPLPAFCIPGKHLRWDDSRLLGTCLHCGRFPARGHAEDCKGVAALKERLVREHLESLGTPAR